jgi:hypothetical protein
MKTYNIRGYSGSLPTLARDLTHDGAKLNGDSLLRCDTLLTCAPLNTDALVH